MTSPIILWFRRDLRLSDHAALAEAVAFGRPVIPLFVHDELVEGLGAAPKWRLSLSVEAHGKALSEKGSRLILRRGKALEVLQALISESGAGAVWWSRAYDPDSIERDKAVKSALKEADVEARSFPGHVLFEPWRVETGDGGFYKVYSPFWRNVRSRDVPEALPAPGRIPAPDTWPDSDTLDDWAMGSGMRRGAEIVAEHATVGESAAQSRLGAFIAHKVECYKEQRNFPAEDATSGLSENLTYGEISPAACWRAGWRAVEDGKAGAEHFLKELVWRDFAYHLAYHTPHMLTTSWREGWDGFPWSEEVDADVRRWQQGRTGIEIVDAGLREMYVTGTMHNRVRMIVASYLTKHMMTHWRIGQRWFEDCLTDWDPASNAMGWQWVAGSGPDAAPYFRVFNPETQAEKFDPDGTYRRRWIAEGQARPTKTALSYFEAVPKAWGLSPDDPYPVPLVGLKEGRERALSAYENRGF